MRLRSKVLRILLAALATAAGIMVCATLLAVMLLFADYLLTIAIAAGVGTVFAILTTVVYGVLFKEEDN